MATLRKDRFAARKPKGERGRSSFYGIHRRTGFKTTPVKLPFNAAIDDVYGPHVVFEFVPRKQSNDKHWL